MRDQPPTWGGPGDSGGSQQAWQAQSSPGEPYLSHLEHPQRSPSWPSRPCRDSWGAPMPDPPNPGAPATSQHSAMEKSAGKPGSLCPHQPPGWQSQHSFPPSQLGDSDSPPTCLHAPRFHGAVSMCVGMWLCVVSVCMCVPVSVHFAHVCKWE